MQGVDSVIASVKNLPSLPIVAVKIIQQIKREKLSNNELAEIIESADKALYNSKNTGRNKLSIAQ